MKKILFVSFVVFLITLVLAAPVMAQIKTIDTPIVAEHVSNYATFTSNNQKVISNQYGIFITYQYSAGDASYLNIIWRLARSTDGGKTFTTIYESTDPTNPPTIETDSQGIIYLIRNDHTEQGRSAYLYRFYPEKDFKNPTITTIPDAGFSGKFGMILDESRHQIYYAKHNPMFMFTIGLDGTVKRKTLINTDGVAFANYPQFTMDEHNNLYLAWVTNKGSNANYRSIHVIKSLDGGVTWRKLDGTTLTLPVVADETGPTDMLIFHSELTGSSWLSSFIVKNNKIHFVYNTWDLNNGTWIRGPQYYARYDLTTGQRDKFIEGTWKGETLAISNSSAVCATDRADTQSPIYCTSADKDRRMVTLVSYDNGDSWHDFAVSAPFPPDPQFPALNNDNYENIYSIGGYRSITSDGMIIGTFTELSGVLHDARIHFFKISLNPSPTPTPTPTPKPGDLNGDGKVDIFDYNLLVTNFGKTGTARFSPADINGDGKVDIFDYNVLVGNFGLPAQAGK
ncbi:MAG TPA: dockerin type I domain-containing protein [Patescibacteria group bacterium]|nr:dockerin type I domain-containing protein [Patescibacteria group bacterium]